MAALNKPTMHDVARVAGVGTMTVSRVLTGSAPVAEETARRVYQAIKKLNYRPNEMARALRGIKTRTIGLIVPYLYDPFFATCAHAINIVARENGYSVILTTSSEDPKTEYEEALLMLQRHVDGLLIIPANGAPTDGVRTHLTGPEFAKTHIVLLDRPLSGSRFDSVVVQNGTGAKRAVEHLISHGHKRITFAGLSRHLYTVKARMKGYRQAMQEAGLPVQISFDCGSQEATSSLIRSLLESEAPPTAFFSFNNLTTRYLLRALLDLRICIPDQVALAGFDDLELAEVLAPTLTVVRQPAHELGLVAAGRLFERMRLNEFPEAGNRIVLPVELVIRHSCGCKPGH